MKVATNVVQLDKQETLRKAVQGRPGRLLDKTCGSAHGWVSTSLIQIPLPGVVKASWLCESEG